MVFVNRSCLPPQLIHIDTEPIVAGCKKAITRSGINASFMRIL